MKKEYNTESLIEATKALLTPGPMTVIYLECVIMIKN